VWGAGGEVLVMPSEMEQPLGSDDGGDWPAKGGDAEDSDDVSSFRRLVLSGVVDVDLLASGSWA